MMQYALRDLLIDKRNRKVRRGGVPVKLSDLSLDTLLALVEAAPDPLGLEQLAARVWKTNHVSEETVAQRIALLRKALGDEPKEPKYIRTVRGAGYAISGEVERREPVQAQPTSRSHPWRIAASVAIASVFASGAIWLVRANGDASTEPHPIAAAEDLNTTLVKRAKAQLNLHQSTETDRAIAMLNEALEDDPDDFDARLTLSFALSTKATKFGGDINDKTAAETLARGLVKERPADSNAWSALGYSLGSQGQMGESLAALQYAYQLDPNNAPAGSSAAHVLLIQGQLYQALDLEFRVRASGGRSRYAEIQIAQTLELIDHPSAADWHERALSLNPGQVVVLSEIARSHLRHSRPAAALEVLAQAAGDDTFSPSVLQLRARAQLALGQDEAARRNLEAAGWRGEYELAAMDALAGNRERALELLAPSEMAKLASDPDPEFRILLAEVAAAAGRTDEAINLLAQAINLGWRDMKWLRQSLFLYGLMKSPEARALEERVVRELGTQRKLTDGDKTLTLAINGASA